MEFVKLTFYVAMFIISMVQMTRSKKKSADNTNTEPAASSATVKPSGSRSRRQKPANNRRQKPTGKKRSRRPAKVAGPNSMPRRQTSSEQTRATTRTTTDHPQTTVRFEAAPDDPSESAPSRPIPGFAAFVGFPLLVGLVGGCGSWLFHGRQATAVGVMAGAATGFFAAIMYTLYHSTNHPDWEPPTVPGSCGAQHRPVSLFAARAIPTGAVGGMLIGWMIPARGNWEVFFAPFVLMLFGVLAAMFISLLHEAAERRTARHR